MWRLTLLTFSLAFATDLQVLFLTSSSTPESISISLNSITLSKAVSITYQDYSSLSESTLPNFFLLIDATYAMATSITLQDLAQTYQISYACLYYNPFVYNGNNFSLLPGPSNVVGAINVLLENFDWTNFAIFTSEDAFSMDCAETLSKLYPGLKDNYFLLAEDLEQASIQSMLAKILKPSSIKVFVVLANEKTATKILNALKAKKMFVEGTGVVVYGEGNINVNAVGLVGVVPVGLEQVSGYASFYSLAVERMLKFVVSRLPAYYDQGLLNEVMLEYLNGLDMNYFSLLNTQVNGRNVVGTIKDLKLSLAGQMVFLGNVTKFTQNFRTPIVFGYAGGQNNGVGMAATSFNPGQMLGVLFATKIANNDSTLLPNFNFTPTYTDCGVNTNNQSYIFNCLNNNSNLGIGFLSTAWYPSTVPYVDYFSPSLVVGTDTSTEMSNETQYPSFVRVTAPTTYSVVVLMTVIKIYGWKQVSLLCTNIEKFMSMCNLFKTLAATNGINIVNNPDLQIIANLYTSANFVQNKPILQELVDCGARIFVALIPSTDLYYLAEGLYDLGIRAGDLQILFQSKTGGNICVTSVPPVVCSKRLEVLPGLVGVYMAEWSGTYGQQMHSEIIPIYGSYTDFKCTSFDQGMLLMRGIANVVNMGYDYEDPSVLNSYIRRMRFVGCSGTVSISQGSNDRSNQPTYMTNLYLVNGSFVEYPTAIYNPSSQNPFETYKPVVWTGGSGITPSDYRFSLNCPFDETKATDSGPGFTALYVLTFMFGLYSLVLIGAFVKKFYHGSFEMISSRTVITGQDMAVFLFMTVEVFQYFSLGITPSDSSSIIKSISSLTGINFHSFLTVTGSNYWRLVLIIIIIAWIMQAFTVLVILRNKRVIVIRSSVCNCLDFISEYVLPVYGEIGFIPIVSVILDMYACTKSVQYGLTNSYNPSDCNTYCWTGSYLNMAVLGIITLTVFLPFFLYLRPSWQRYQKSLNIKQNPRYSLYKSAFQMFAVVLSKTVYNSSEIAFGFLFTGYILVYAVSLKWIKRYSYDICNLWLWLSLLVAAYTELLYSISLFAEFQPQYVALALFVGWALLASGCVLIQNKYYQSLLYSEPSKNIPEIFAYVFRNNGSKYLDDKDESQYN